jgi:uncharacterized SAM-binding protein YcdF (DUF218 family)
VFPASKTLDLFVEPLFWGICMLFWCAAVLWRSRRRSAVSAATIGSLLWLASSNAVAMGLWTRLESGVAAKATRSEPYDAVIVLGGAVDEAPTWRRMTERGLTFDTLQELHGYDISMNENAERLTAAWEVTRSGAARQVLLSGGSWFPSSIAPPESVLASRLLQAWGIAESRIVLETESRNTRENADYTKRIADARGWKSLLLVTSAFHMPRAEKEFERAGLSVDTLPVDFRAVGGRAGGAPGTIGANAPATTSPVPSPPTPTPPGALDLLPRSRSLSITAAALREYLGRAVAAWRAP